MSALTTTDSPTARALDAAGEASWQRRIVRLLGAGCFFNFYEVALGSLIVTLVPAAWVEHPLAKAALIGSAFAGEFLGAALLSGLADRLGRRPLFRLNLLAYAALSALSALSPTLALLVTGRFLVGIGLGAELTLVDTYVTELMPAAHRGRRLAQVYLRGFIGVPVAAIAATVIPDPFGGVASWRILLLSAASAAVVLWWLRRGLPESPRWLESRKRLTEAQETLTALGARRDVAPIAPTSAATAPVALSRTESRRRVWLACLLQGVGSLGFYGFASLAPLVLVDKGYDVVDSLTFSAISVLGYPLGAALLVPLAERVQRRTLVVVSTALVAPCGLVFGVATTSWLIVIAGFLTGLASVVQATAARAYVAELFPTDRRAGRVGTTYSLSRLVAAVMPFVAIPLLDAAGAGAVYACSAVLILALAILTWRLGPRLNGAALG